MSRYAAFLDEAFGERRGVLFVDGRPERLLIEREGLGPSARLGAVAVARVRRIERALGTAFLELPDGVEAAAPAGQLTEGQAVEIEVTAEARAEKACVVRITGPGEGDPRPLRAAPSLESRLFAWTGGARPTTGPAARDAADLAEDAALATAHDLPGGGRLFMEATRALVAVDVDLGARAGGDPKRVARQTNLSAIAETARLLRLKSLGGLVVIDLVGKGHDGAAMSAAAKAAFAPEGESVSIGPVSRFGLFELSVPHSFRPAADIICDASGRPSAPTMALRLARAVEREGRADPGARLIVRCAAEVAESFASLRGELAHRLGERFDVQPIAGAARDLIQVSAQ